MTASRTVFLLLAALLGGCASGPKFDSAGVDPQLTPGMAVGEAQRLSGERVLWGGVIIASSNLQDASQLEVLGYPLDSAQKPLLRAEPLGRFLVLQQGYLETADYAQGRLITVIGNLSEPRPGRIGESDYTYPVVQAERIHLWPRDSAAPDTRFHFGIGVIFSR